MTEDTRTLAKLWKDSEGDFSPPRPADRACRKCKSTDVVVQTWTSKDGGYEDNRYTCKACGVVWWVDGIDS